jgi:hypothetical protein
MRTSLLLISLLILHLVQGFVASSRGTTTAVVFRPQQRLPTYQQQQQLQQQHRRPQQHHLTVGAVAPGGGSSEVATTKKGKCPYTATMRLLSTTWGVLGVVYILAKAIIRVAPIALEPFQTGAVPLQPWQLAYVYTLLFMLLVCVFQVSIWVFSSNSSHKTTTQNEKRTDSTLSLAFGLRTWKVTRVFRPNSLRSLSNGLLPLCPDRVECIIFCSHHCTAWVCFMHNKSV